MFQPSPNLVQRTHVAPRIVAVVDALAEEGIASSRVLAGTELAPSDLRSPDTRVSYRQVEIVFRNALRLSKDPAIALRAGQRMHVMTYGMSGYALMSSSTPAEAIRFATKYGRDLGMVADIFFARDGDVATFVLGPLLSRNPADDLYRFVLEFAFATCQTLCKAVYGRAFEFSRLRAAYPPPPHARLYKRIFACPVLFEQTGSELEFDAAWIDGPKAHPDAAARATAAGMCQQFLDDTNLDGGIAADIRRALLEQPGRFPAIEAMAGELALHPRALRRKLEAQGLTYRDLVADVRMRLAIVYLRDTQMTNDEIAARLDYSDAANFRHAFARWTGKSPSAFRTAERLAPGALSAGGFVPK